MLATCFASTKVMAQTSPGEAQAAGLSRADVENIVRRSLQYVALYDTLLNFTFNQPDLKKMKTWKVPKAELVK